MKGYKKLMDFVALVEKAVLAATMVLILVLTVGNVFSRKVIHQSWSFTEELVVAICSDHPFRRSIVCKRGRSGRFKPGNRAPAKVM